MTDKNQNKLLKIKDRVKHWRSTRGNKRHWPAKLKTQITTLIREGMTISEISRVTEIRSGTIYKWFYQSKSPKLFRELVVTPQTTTSPINIVKECSIETVSGHLVRLSFSSLNDLFKAGVL